jgi:hypothetical protein
VLLLHEMAWEDDAQNDARRSKHAVKRHHIFSFLLSMGENCLQWVVLTFLIIFQEMNMQKLIFKSCVIPISTTYEGVTPCALA